MNTQCTVRDNSMYGCPKWHNSIDRNIYNAVKAYNETIHSVTGERPIDVKNNPSGYPEIPKRILEKQEAALAFHNNTRKNRIFTAGEIIYVKSSRRRKDASAYARHIALEDLGNSVRTTNNKVFHKDNRRTNEKNEYIHDETKRETCENKREWKNEII